MKARVYVDGFNFYYGCLKRTPFRWLDLEAFCKKMLPRDEVTAIKYFTAKVQARPGRGDAVVDQALYLRALETLPSVAIYYGRFLNSEIWAQLVDPPEGGKPSVKVHKTEEKGSDVNLATHLLVDGFKDEYELAVVVSNDGDLKAPIEYVRLGLGKPVGVLNPGRIRSYALSPSALPAGSFYKPIRSGALRTSQLAPRMIDERGAFEKPADW